MYRSGRSYENLNKAIFAGEGKYNIPILKPSNTKPEEWIGFNYAKGCNRPEGKGIHFFLDDYQFARVWAEPDRYIGILQRFQTVMTPDFSLYMDFPKAVQIYNHYRKHWLGAYWQAKGIQVIPTIGWSDEESFEWCFDGEPRQSIVAVSSVGTQGQEDARKQFLAGYFAMLEKLKPTQIIFYGKVPEECKENIVRVKQFCDKWNTAELAQWE